jgi:hypothetical protein
VAAFQLAEALQADDAGLPIAQGLLLAALAAAVG